MSKLVWIENHLTFKIQKVYTTQYLCVCSSYYKEELGLEVGDILFVKDKIKKNSFRRLGIIKAFNNNYVIVGIMSNLGVASKSRMAMLHTECEEEGISEDEIDNDGSLY